MLHELLHGVARAESARELKLRVMDDVPDLFGAGATGLYLFGPDGNVNELHTRGVRDGFIFVYEQMGRGNDPILERALATRAAAHDALVFRGDGWQRSALYLECGGPWLIRHYLCVPILVDGQVVGTLNLGRRSEAHPFGPGDSADATAVCRAVAERLRALARAPEGASATERPTIEELGRLRAEQVRVRLHAAALERGGVALDAQAADALWSEVAAGRVTPLDCFDEGDRTYLLLPIVDARTPAPRRPLTAREAQVVARAAAGLSNKEIAFELGISVNTVGSALLAAREKLGAASRVALVATARRIGLAR